MKQSSYKVKAKALLNEVFMLLKIVFSFSLIDPIISMSEIIKFYVKNLHYVLDAMSDDV